MLDLIDVPGFDLNQVLVISKDRGEQDLDGATRLINAVQLLPKNNRVDGLGDLQPASLAGNHTFHFLRWHASLLYTTCRTVSVTLAKA